MKGQPMPWWARWIVVLAVGAVLAWASNHAFRAARTGKVLLDALQSLRIWPGEVPPPPDLWSAMWERLEAAKTLEPDNPTTEEMLGLLAARRYDDHRRLTEATDHYVRALRLRPISANTWANLAAARYLVGDTSRVFESAIQNAARLGPSNPQVQRIVAHHGLAVFDEVSAPTRRAIESMVAAGVRRAPGEMLGIAHRRGRLEIACRYLPETRRTVDPRWERLCAR